MSNGKTILKGIASALITLFSLQQTVGNPKACWAYLIADSVIIILALIFYKKNKQDAIIALVSVAIMVVYSSIGLVNDRDLRKNETIWLGFLHSRPEDSFGLLKKRADSGDGPAQLELSAQYARRVDYCNALKYAQKAADNGSSRACSIVANYQIFGMGCIADIHQGVYNLIRAQRYDNYNVNPILDEMATRGISISENDMKRLTKSVEIQKRLYEIRNRISSIDGIDQTINAISLVYKEIEGYSNNGYLPATELLFYYEFLKSPNGSSELNRLANVLYQASYLPTEPTTRGYLLSVVYDDMSYSSDKYKQYINDNNYYLVGIIDALYGDSDAYPRNYDRYSNSLLMSEYEFYRSQYNWFERIIEGTIDVNRISFTLRPENYNKDLSISKTLLLSIIEGIKDRMKHPEQGVSEKENWVMSHRHELSFSRH